MSMGRGGHSGHWAPGCTALFHKGLESVFSRVEGTRRQEERVSHTASPRSQLGALPRGLALSSVPAPDTVEEGRGPVLVRG